MGKERRERDETRRWTNEKVRMGIGTRGLEDLGKGKGREGKGGIGMDGWIDGGGIINCQWSRGKTTGGKMMGGFGF